MTEQHIAAWPRAMGRRQAPGIRSESSDLTMCGRAGTGASGHVRDRIRWVRTLRPHEGQQAANG